MTRTRILGSILFLMASTGTMIACDEVAELAGVDSVSECQDKCDDYRFFECYDAARHAGCYDDCASASEDDIDKYVNCGSAVKCDLECSVNIEGRSEGVPAADRVDTGRTPTQTQNPSNCQSACSAMVADMCVPSDCATYCSDSDAAFAIVYCNNVRSGCDFPAECTGGSSASPADQCKAGCQQMQFFDCLSAAEGIACNQQCDQVDDATATLFASCTQSAGICDRACYSALDPNVSTADVEGCKDACDSQSRFDCIDAATQGTCRNKCDSASDNAIENFKACSQGICDENDGCYSSFAASN